MNVKIFASLAMMAGLALGGDIAPKCLAYRSLDTPKPQPGLTNCPQYRDLACCTTEVDSVIVPGDNHTQLYNFNWDQCGELSPRCERFFQAESCYWECDPYQAPWANPTSNNPVVFNRIPICSSYCNDWFEACKSDLTCGVEWLVDFKKVGSGSNETYQCADGTHCKTFAEIFDNGQGLCDLLWGSAFVYSEDVENCVVWDFPLTSGNLNKHVEKKEYNEVSCLVTEPTESTKSKDKEEPACLAGRTLSTPQKQNLNTCSRYESLSCCDADFDKGLTAKDTSLLGYGWDHCGELSPQCEEFFFQQSCYYHCDPYVHQWANPIFKNPENPIGVPICADYCDAWFEACKKELTCANEWLIDFVPKPDGSGYTCPDDSKCITFEEVFENSRGLCDTMWGSDYHYSKDPNQCVRWDFKGSNPNVHVKPQPFAAGVCYVEEEKRKTNSAAIAIGVIFGLVIVALAATLAFVLLRQRKNGGDISLN